MRTFRCARCGAIWNSEHSTSQCRSCRLTDSSEIISEESNYAFRIIRRENTLTHECRSVKGIQQYQWDSSPPNAVTAEMIASVIGEWLSEGLDGA